MLYAVAVKLFVGVTKHPIPMLRIPSTIGTKINPVLLLVLGRLNCKCTALQCSFESFSNFTQYSNITIHGIFSIIEQKKYKKVDYKKFFISQIISIFVVLSGLY